MTNKLTNIINWKSSSVIEINWKKPWNTTTIMVWVHWNELSWVNALLEILDEIKIISWKIYFIFANLKALKLNQRQFEKNMNRCFIENNIWTTYEDKRANEITPYLQKSDYLLDVHNTLNKNNSIPFLISEYKELWQYFQVDLVVSGFDELHKWWSDWYMNLIWKKWICLESWSIYDEKWVEIAKNWILNFLKFTKNISGNPKTYEKQKFINFDNIYKNKTLNFRFTKEFLDFEKVNLWQIIAYDWEEKIISQKDWYIVFTYNPKNIWDECFCFWEEI